MTASHEDHYPEGFGFRTGMRCEAVAGGSGVLVLLMGSVFVVLGTVLAVGEGLWGWVVVLALFELAFVAAYAAMLHMARQRHRPR
ncbi:hypothetical protein HER39_09165 [Arthrobacter deserti]|uniref:Integral membrane protein n=1 Tax=Arthrobacter deserti TaxID=1742687 RepID=A0ABX1JPH7_9MICC|nr:hypothetical protein [Arthrobacter deserti]